MLQKDDPDEKNNLSPLVPNSFPLLSFFFPLSFSFFLSLTWISHTFLHQNLTDRLLFSSNLSVTLLQDLSTSNIPQKWEEVTEIFFYGKKYVKRDDPS